MFARQGPRLRVATFIWFAISTAAAAGYAFIHISQKSALETLQLTTSEHFSKEVVAKALDSLLESNDLQTNIALVDGKKIKNVKVRYTIDPEAQAFVQKELTRYRPDYAAFVALEATTGRVLAMSSYQHRGEKLGNLALRTTFPAASVFKVVTASAAIDQRKVNADTKFSFSGGKHTLYKRNVFSTTVAHWSREISIREAFAKSINSIFGKIGVFEVGPQILREYARRFLFNQNVRSDFPAPTGTADIQEDDRWALAEAASGFTRNTTMSPIQGALIAAAIANDGIIMEPTIVDSIYGEGGELLYQSQPSIASVTMTTASAQNVRLLMQETVTTGTSRKQFRSFWRNRNLAADVELGGKTGSLHGNDPYGRYDWFVGYMLYKQQKIAVAALTINEEKWRVKSASLVQSFLSGRLKDEISRSPSTVTRHN